MTHSKYITALQALSKNVVFSSADGKKAGIPARMLAYFCARDQIERIGRGMYAIKEIDFDADFEWEELAVTALSIPNGVICLISALCYYGMTDEFMREFWIAVPHNSTAPVRRLGRMVRMRNLTFGQTAITIGKQKVKIFDRERTVIDAFRYLDEEVALKALRAYLQAERDRRPDIRKLVKYARKFRVDLSPYIAAFLL